MQPNGPLHNPVPRMALLALTCLALALGACGDPSDPSTGTGSAGGNPLTFAFQTNDSAALVAVSWDTPLLIVSELFVGVDEGQGCALGDEPHFTDLSLSFNGQDELTIEPPTPCALELRAATGESLLQLQAAIGDEVLALDFGKLQAIRIDIVRPELLEDSQNAVVVFELDALLDGIDLSDLTTLLGDLLGGDLQLRDQVVDNLGQALTIYIDPDPTDGELREDEQIEANVLAEVDFTTR